MDHPTKTENGVTLYDVSRPGGVPVWVQDPDKRDGENPEQEQGEKKPAKAEKTE